MLADWRHRACPSEFAKAGDPTDPSSHLMMGPFSDLLEQPGTFCGLQDEAILEVLRHGRIVEARRNGGGVSVSYRLEISYRGRLTRALFKPIQQGFHTLPRAEVAAYRLNRLLGLNRVPPTVARRVSAHGLARALFGQPADALLAQTGALLFRDGSFRGQVTWWIPRIAFLPWHLPRARRAWRRWLTAGEPLPAAWYDLAGQMSKMLTFDYFINNQDRLSGGNVVATPDGRRLYFMDNGMALVHVPDRNSFAWKAFRSVQRFSRSLLDALERATPDRIERALRIREDRAIWFLVTKPELDDLLRRRRVILTRAAESAIRHGWKEAMYFP